MNYQLETSRAVARDTVHILEGARRTLAPEDGSTWSVYEDARDTLGEPCDPHDSIASRWSLLGAVDLNSDCRLCAARGEAEQHLYSAIKRRGDRELGKLGSTWQRITSWHDADHRRLDDVRAVLDVAIGFARAELAERGGAM